MDLILLRLFIVFSPSGAAPGPTRPEFPRHVTPTVRQSPTLGNFHHDIVPASRASSRCFTSVSRCFTGARLRRRSSKFLSEDEAAASLQSSRTRVVPDEQPIRCFHLCRLFGPCRACREKRHSVTPLVSFPLTVLSGPTVPLKVSLNVPQRFLLAADQPRRCAALRKAATNWTLTTATSVRHARSAVIALVQRRANQHSGPAPHLEAIRCLKEVEGEGGD